MRTRRIPYVHARVVLAGRPTSAKPGDEAIIYADGSMEGFVGGSAAVESSLQLNEDSIRYYFCGPGCLAAFAADHADPPT